MAARFSLPTTINGVVATHDKVVFTVGEFGVRAEPRPIVEARVARLIRAVASQVQPRAIVTADSIDGSRVRFGLGFDEMHVVTFAELFGLFPRFALGSVAELVASARFDLTAFALRFLVEICSGCGGGFFDRALRILHRALLVARSPVVAQRRSVEHAIVKHISRAFERLRALHLGEWRRRLRDRATNVSFAPAADICALVDIKS